jgi:hypothetical protein
MDYPQVEQILKGSRSLATGGIEMTYRRYNTATARLLAWQGNHLFLFESRLGNYFTTSLMPDKTWRIEPITRREAMLAFERMEREIFVAEAFPAEMEVKS